MDCDSDHLPISVVFDWTWQKATPSKRRQWIKTDVPKLRTTVSANLPQPSDCLADRESIDLSVAHIIKALEAGIEESTPWTNLSPRSIPGFNQECKDLCTHVQQLRRRWQWSRLEDDYEAYRVARNKKGRFTQKLLRSTYRQKVEEASSTPSGLWKLVKWAKSRHELPATCTPELVKPDGGIARMAQDKAKVLCESFFTPPAEADLSDIDGYQYPSPIECPNMTMNEIEKAVKSAAPHKAPGADGITNGILQLVLDILLPSLYRLFNACLEQGYCPAHFQDSVTVALRKPGKEDYRHPKSYRPIALLNTLGKVLEGIMANRLAYLADEYQLLPRRP